LCNSKDHIRDPTAPSLLLRIPFSIRADRRTDRPSNRNPEKRDSVTAETSQRPSTRGDVCRYPLRESLARRIFGRRNNTALVDWCIPKRPGLDRYIDILLGSPAKMMSRRTEKRYGASYNRQGRNRGGGLHYDESDERRNTPSILFCRFFIPPVCCRRNPPLDPKSQRRKKASRRMFGCTDALFVASLVVPSRYPPPSSPRPHALSPPPGMWPKRRRRRRRRRRGGGGGIGGGQSPIGLCSSYKREAFQLFPSQLAKHL
jgi:hypothetical protein